MCRAVAYNFAIAPDAKAFAKVTVDDELIREALGNAKFDFKMDERITKPGNAIVSFIYSTQYHYRVLPIPKLEERPF